MRKPPQLVQYQGSKRNLALNILSYFPKDVLRVIEPFSGTAAISIAAALNHKSNRFIINDLNKPLIELFDLVINRPDIIANDYEKIWNEQHNDSIGHYNLIRERFNKTQEPALLLYLLARCVKGAIRYNNQGFFNQSPDKRRKGTKPETMKKRIFEISSLMNGKAELFAQDYKEILMLAKDGDLVYLDPPYQGVCGDRDSRYLSPIDHDEFITELSLLNKKNIDYIISYDGKCGDTEYGNELPINLKLYHIGLDAGRSTQSTLLGRDENTIESLYLSPSLIEKIGCDKWEKKTHYQTRL